MNFKVTFGRRWFYLCLFSQRFTTFYYVQMECGHNSTRHLLTIWKIDSENDRGLNRAGTFIKLGERKTKLLKRLV